jgi:hypothetical protein
MKIHLAVAELIHADRWTDVMKLIGAFEYLCEYAGKVAVGDLFHLR